MKILEKIRWRLACYRLLLLGRIFGIEYVVSRLPACGRAVTGCVVARLGACIGPGTYFKGGILLDNVTGDRDSTADLSNLHIGANCYIGRQVFFDLPAPVKLGDDVVVSAFVKFLTHFDTGRRPMSKYYPRQVSSIEVGDNCYIGAGAVLLPGVHLGKYCVVGAGSVVTKSFPDYSVIAGVPARLVKTLPADEL